MPCDFICCYRTGQLCVGSDRAEAGETDRANPMHWSVCRHGCGFIDGRFGAGLGPANIFNDHDARTIRVCLAAMGRVLVAGFGSTYFALANVSGLRDKQQIWETRCRSIYPGERIFALVNAGL